MRIHVPTITDVRFYDELYRLLNRMECKVNYYNAIELLCAEWYWSEGDESLSVIDLGFDNGVNIYINEVFVSTFKGRRVEHGRLGYSTRHIRPLRSEDILYEMIELIDTWKIGV